MTEKVERNVGRPGVRGASLPTEAVLAGFWAVLASVHPPESRMHVARIDLDDKTVDIIAERFGSDPTGAIAAGAAVRREVEEDKRTLSISLDQYEKARMALGSCERAKAGRAAWPPGAQTIATRLGGGSWSAALRSLGIASSNVGRTRGSGRLTEEDVVRSVQDFARHCAAEKTAMTYAAYTEWARAEKASGRLRPSGPTVRQKCGTWSAALTSAGL